MAAGPDKDSALYWAVYKWPARIGHSVRIGNRGGQGKARWTVSLTAPTARAGS